MMNVTNEVMNIGCAQRVDQAKSVDGSSCDRRPVVRGSRETSLDVSGAAGWSVVRAMLSRFG